MYEEALRIALKRLESGDFSGAKEAFGETLERHPDDAESVCGLYAAGYWHNRSEILNTLKQGRARGSYLVREWDSFQSNCESRDCTATHAFRCVMRAVLGEASEQFRLAFQEEGASALDAELLAELGRCLIRIEDYKNAAEIMHFAARYNPGKAVILFLLGEALCSQASPESLAKGLGYYRDAALADPKSIDPSLIGSSPAADVFDMLYIKFEKKTDLVFYWFSPYLMCHSMLPGLRVLFPAEVSELKSEIARLSRDVNVVSEQYREKTRARLCFFILVLIQHYLITERDTETGQELEHNLRAADSAIFNYYKSPGSKTVV